MTVGDLVARIHAAPRGAHVAAYFEYDGALISGSSATAFYRRRLRGFDVGPAELARAAWAGVRGVRTASAVVQRSELSLEAWCGSTPEELSALGESLFKHEIAAALRPEAWRLVEAHHRMGHTVVLVTSQTRFHAEPMARDIGAEHVLCTQVEVLDGVLTGRVLGAPMWGLAKARAVRSLARDHDVDLGVSFAYGHDDADVMFLETVGNPVAVQPEQELADQAAARGWATLRCEPRGGLPDPAGLLRTVAFWGGIAAGAGFGAGASLLGRSRREAVDVGIAVGSDLSLALAGVDVRVVSGEQYLISARPCVFLFNHQSKIDPFVLTKVLRGGVTGVAKEELKNVPGLGQLFQVAGVAFIDRNSATRARNMLEPALAKVRDEGMSLIIAPEGTRSATPRLGEFKRGAFHIAMQAGVPVVPIVIRNAGELMWRGAQMIRRGTVEVVVLPPVETSDWQRRTIGKHTERVRDMYVSTLANWPQPT